MRIKRSSGSGTPGAPGDPGVPGAPGAVGPAVFLEAEAIEGEPGPPGARGVDGAPGTPGGPGSAGATGPGVFLEAESGEDGPPGPPGAAGVAGAPGAPGSPGAAGPMGPAVFLEAEFIEGEPGMPGPAGATGPQGPGGSVSFTTVEKDLDALPLWSGTFDIATAGQTAGKPALVMQAAGPYTGKGDRQDEAEMDLVTATGYVVDATTIRVYWTVQPYSGPVAGNVKFNYLVGA